MYITYDSTASKGFANGSSTTLNHVLGKEMGYNRLVLAITSNRGSSSSVSSVTYNSVSMTLGFSNNGLAIWYLLDNSLPASTGTYSVVANQSNPERACISVSSFYNTSQKVLSSSDFQGSGTTGSPTWVMTNNDGIILLAYGNSAASGAAYTYTTNPSGTALTNMCDYGASFMVGLGVSYTPKYYKGTYGSNELSITPSRGGNDRQGGLVEYHHPEENMLFFF